METTGSVHSEDFLQPNDVEEKQTTNYKREGVNSNTSNGKLYFPTASGYIVNASTGHSYPHKMGTPQEKQFWRVIRAVTKDGVTDGVKTFYDSPEQYEQHIGCRIEPGLKETWRTNIQTHMSTFNKSQTNSGSMKKTYTVVK